MNFGFSREQEELRDAARALLGAECPTSVVRASVEESDAWQPLWKTLTEVGWPGLTLPTEVGGSGFGIVELVALTELAGAHVVPAPFVSTAVLATPLLTAGEAPRELRRAVAAGEVATLAVHGPDARPDDAGDGARWEGGRLTGDRRLVTDAVRAAWLVVPAVDAAGERVVAAVPRDADGVGVTAVDNVDPTRPLARVHLDARPAHVWSADVGAALDAARAGLAAELLGVADRALTATVDHARNRRQFDRPIGAFQAVKHRLADAYIAVERARTLTYRAAMLLDDDTSGPRDRTVAVAMAKAAASDAAVRVCKDAVQLHGAIAMTFEHDAHLYLRRARQSAALLGDARHHYRAVGAATMR